MSRWARERNLRRRMKNHFVHLETSSFVLHCLQLEKMCSATAAASSTVWCGFHILQHLREFAEQRTKLSSDFYQLLISSRVHGTLNSILFCENLADFTTHTRKWRKNEKVDWEWCHKKCEWEDDTNEEAEDLHEIYDFSFRSSFTYYEVPHIDEGLTFFSGGANGREWRRKKIYSKF